MKKQFTEKKKSSPSKSGYTVQFWVVIAVLIAWFLVALGLSIAVGIIYTDSKGMLDAVNAAIEVAIIEKGKTGLDTFTVSYKGSLLQYWSNQKPTDPNLIFATAINVFMPTITVTPTDTLVNYDQPTTLYLTTQFNLMDFAKHGYKAGMFINTQDEEIWTYITTPLFVSNPGVSLPDKISQVQQISLIHGDSSNNISFIGAKWDPTMVAALYWTSIAGWLATGICALISLFIGLPVVLKKREAKKEAKKAALLAEQNVQVVIA